MRPWHFSCFSFHSIGYPGDTLFLVRGVFVPQGFHTEGFLTRSADGDFTILSFPRQSHALASRLRGCDRIRELRCSFGCGLHGDEHVDHDSGDEPGDMQSRDVTRRMQSVHIHVLKT